MGWSYRVVVEDAVHLAAGWVAIYTVYGCQKALIC